MNKMAIQIQKEKNAINITILLFILCFFNMHSQNIIKGTFCVDYDLKDFSSCLKFNENREFIFNHSGDTGILEYGKGEYKLTDNQLILNYNKTPVKKLGYYNFSIWKNNLDSIDIIVSVFNKRTKAPIKYANVFFKDSTNKVGYTGFSANESGMVNLTTTKDKNTIELNVIYIGFLEQKINLTRNKNYMIEVYLKEIEDENGIPILNQIDTLELVQYNKKQFKVKNKNGSLITWRKMEE